MIRFPRAPGAPLLVTLVLALLALSPAQSTLCRVAKAQDVAALKAEALPLVQCGDKRATGVFLNAQGHLAAPAIGSADAEWLVEFEGEKYPARVASAQPKYGLMILQIERAQGFVPAPLAPGMAPANAKLKLVGRDAKGEVYARDVGVGPVRRGLRDKGLQGSFYPLLIAGEAPRDGAVLVDAERGHVVGLMVSEPATENAADAARHALFASSIGERVALENIALGVPEKPSDKRRIVLAGGGSKGADFRLSRFGVYSEVAQQASYARAVQDWRRNTGFWINTMTAPVIEGDAMYFGSIDGRLYCLDLEKLQRQWVYNVADIGEAVFFAPQVAAGDVLVSAGNLGFTARQENDPLLAGALAGLGLGGLFNTRKTKLAMFDHGSIYCVDRKSGVFRWEYRTRFASRPHVVGDKVLFSGVESLGVLKLSDGKKVWERPSDRQTTSPRLYSIAGVEGDKMWVLVARGKVVGDGSRKEPMRMLKDNEPARVQCYSINAANEVKGEPKPLWETNISTIKDAPAFSITLQISSDKKTLYGATSKDVFAIEAESGKLLWQTPIFAEEFGGNIVWGDQMIFATGSDNKLYAINATDGSRAWVFGDARAPLSLPLAQDGLVYAGSLDTWIYTLDARTGQLVWKFETDGRVSGQPRVVGNKLYCMSDAGHLTEIILPQ